MRISERLYRILLRLYPSEFREEYGGEMSAYFREQAREGRLLLWMQVLRDLLLHAPQEHLHMLSQDIRYAFRSWRRSPVFAAVAIGALTLGIGANTAIFSVVHAVLLRPLPFEDPGRLVRLYETSERRNINSFTASVPNYLSWKEQARSLDVAAFSDQALNWTGAGEAERLEGAAITSSLPSVLGVTVWRGRWFVEEEERRGRHQTAVLSYDFWRTRLEEDPDVIGRKLIFNGAPYTVVGVAAEGFRFPLNPDLWVPKIIEPAQENRGNRYVTVIGRLKPGFSADQAEAEMVSIARELGRTYPESNEGWSVRIVCFSDWIVEPEIRTALVVLLAAVGMVLLIACANVANLLLARAAARRKEIAIRAALGAGAARLSRQLITESLLLSLSGGLLGLLGAGWIITAARRALADILPRADEISIDFTVFAFAVATSVLTGLLFGAAPLWQACRRNLVDALRQAGRSSQGAGHSRLRNGLVVAQAALATLLLVAAGLLIQSLARLQSVSPGFDPERVLTAQIATPRARYENGEALLNLYSRLVESLNSSPGVRNAGVSSGIPFGPSGYTSMPAAAVGSSPLRRGETLSCSWRLVDSGYFRAMSIPILRGRPFGPEDGPDAATGSTLISQEMARRLFGGENPVGRQLRLENGAVLAIIGVVGDVRSQNLSPRRV
ncbi:MAG: ADOP family duplicated permease [Bryobacteraceae bacterium]